MAASSSVVELRGRLCAGGVDDELPGLPGVRCLPGPGSAVALLADTLAGASWARRRGELLSLIERERAARFVFPGLGETWTAARVLLREVLGRVTLTPAQEVPIRIGEYGKPMTEGVEFSLAHTGSLVLIGVGDLPLGVDVEKVPEKRVVEQVGTSLHPGEVAELSALPEEERPKAFARAWVRKEAMCKALGVGLSRGISRDYVSTGVAPGDPVAGLRIHDLRLPGLPEHQAALCVTTPATS